MVGAAGSAELGGATLSRGTGVCDGGCCPRSGLTALAKMTKTMALKARVRSTALLLSTRLSRSTDRFSNRSARRTIGTVRYLVTARLKPGQGEALAHALEDGTLGLG